jgi:hypothetical protein
VVRNHERVAFAMATSESSFDTDQIGLNISGFSSSCSVGASFSGPFDRHLNDRFVDLMRLRS